MQVLKKMCIDLFYCIFQLFPINYFNFFIVHTTQE